MHANALSLQSMDFDETEEISKSQLKREAQALKELGVKVLEFSEDSPRQLALPDTLLEALLTAKKITSNSARKRQLSYIGKLMQDIDPAPVQAAVEAREHQHLTSTREFHLLEDLREKLLVKGDDALPEVLSHFPRAERQLLRKLVRLARSEQSNGQPPGASRRLFRYLRELQETPDY